MKRKLLISIGVLFILAGVSGITELTKSFKFTNLLAVVITLAIGIFMLIKGKNSPKKIKTKKKTYVFRTDVRGTFLEKRQIVLMKLYKEYYGKDVDTNNEVLIYNKVKFVDEPENEYDPNAIAIYTLDNQQLGYVARELTSEFRTNINRDLSFQTYLTIYKDSQKYFADIQVLQKR